MTDRIYLDYAAAAPRWPAVRQLLAEELVPSRSTPSSRSRGRAEGSFGNPDSIHETGRRARATLEDARATLARLLECHADELILTSGATEANNLALYGILHALHEETGEPPHIITSTIEHPSILAPIEALEELGVPVTYVPVTKTGQLDLVALEASILPDTGLVTIMAANNEIGTIQPLRAIRKLLDTYNPKIILHTDAAQLAAWHAVTTDRLQVDALTLSGAKLGGMIASGLLYLKRGTPLVGQLRGGGQQDGRRAGTPDPLVAVTLALALGEVRQALPEAATRVRDLCARLWQALSTTYPEAIRNDQFDGLPNLLSVTIPRLDAETAVYALSAKGVEVSSGSACSTTDERHRGHVLAALGRAGEATSTLRFSLGWQTSEQEIERAIPLIRDVLRLTTTQSNRANAIQHVGKKIATRYAAKR